MQAPELGPSHSPVEVLGVILGWDVALGLQQDAE